MAGQLSAWLRSVVAGRRRVTGGHGDKPELQAKKGDCQAKRLEYKAGVVRMMSWKGQENLL